MLQELTIKEVITFGDEGGMASIGLLQKYTKEVITLSYLWTVLS